MLTDGLEFRPAVPADVPELVGLIESAYRGEASRAGWTTEADLLDGQRTDPEGVQEAMAAGLVLLAEQSGRLLACCQLERRGDTVYLGMFSVRPDQQGNQLGRQVLGEAERRAREDWGAAQLEIMVIEQRADLIGWYERRGFRRTGVYKPFPYGDERFGIPRRPDLRFMELVKEL